MIANKHIAKIIAALMAVAVVLCFVGRVFADQLIEAAGGTGVTQQYESELFDTSEIISINVIMDEDDWNSMLASASSEEYWRCDVEVNGTMFYSVGIRPKGNTSLTSIASDPDTDRFSFKLEFDHFIDGQTCFGLDKLCLNNNYADATNMKEALVYDMYQYMGTDASLYNYATISLNDEYWGLYLAIESVEDSFLLRNYGTESGQLYKPDSLDFGDAMGSFDTSSFDMSNIDTSQFGGGGQGAGGFSFGGQQAPEGFDASQFSGEMPDSGSFDTSNVMGGMGGFSSGSGANLNYIDDNLSSYDTIWESSVTDSSDADHRRVVNALKNISRGTNLEESMDIDNLLSYMAVHVFSVNDDSLTGSMAHNYYLYESDGQLNIIPWDYNLSFGGMGTGGSATSMVNDPIDGAFSATTSFFDALMDNQEYRSAYYQQMQKLVSEYVNGGKFDEFYNRVRSQIDALVQTDPTAFYEYEEYLAAVEELYEVVKLRAQSVQGQLDGSIPSTSSGQKNSDALIDASDIDLSIMGTMSSGGQMGGGMFSMGGMASGGFDASQFGGQAPDGFDASQFQGQTPPSNGQQGSQGFSFGGGQQPSSQGSSAGTTRTAMQAPSTSGQGPGVFSFGGQGGSASGAASQGMEMSQFGNGSFDMSGMGGGASNGATMISGLVTYVVCLIVMIAALVFAKLYRRKHRGRK